MDLAEIADMLEHEARDAALSAGQVEVAATMIRISDETFAYQVGYWRDRAVRMRVAAQTIRRQNRLYGEAFDARLRGCVGRSVQRLRSALARVLKSPAAAPSPSAPTAPPAAR